MGRTATRLLLGFAGGVLMLIGGTAAVLGGWITATLSGHDSLRTAPQVIDASGCSTVVMEIADARVDAGELGRIEPVTNRSQSLFTVRINGETPEPWLVGVADQQVVEQRLLGARYCLVESTDGGWTTTFIAVEPDALDAQFSGVPGRWAAATNGEAVALPVPESGSSVVISGSGESTLDALEVVGELEITGASAAGWVALIGGIATVVLGVGLLLISIFGLRSKGRHEGDEGSALSGLTT